MLVKSKDRLQIWSDGKNRAHGYVFVAYMVLIIIIYLPLILFKGDTTVIISAMFLLIPVSIGAHYFLKERKILELIVDANHVEIYKKGKIINKILLQQINSVFIGDIYRNRASVEIRYTEDKIEKKYVFLIYGQNRENVGKAIKEYKNNVEIKIGNEPLSKKAKIITVCISILMILICIVGLYFRMNK